jgi:hypothetical protein
VFGQLLLVWLSGVRSGLERMAYMRDVINGYIFIGMSNWRRLILRIKHKLEDIIKADIQNRHYTNFT